MKTLGWMLLWLFFLFLWCYPSHGECSPIKLNRGEGIDWNCRLFRRVYRDGHLYIERLRPDRTVLAVEAVDCSKAVLVEGGWMEVPMHIIEGNIWCYTPARRKHDRAKHSIEAGSKTSAQSVRRESAANHTAH